MFGTWEVLSLASSILLCLDLLMAIFGSYKKSEENKNELKELLKPHRPTSLGRF